MEQIPQTDNDVTNQEQVEELDNSSSFIKKFAVFMAVELVVMFFALSYVFKIGMFAGSKTIAEAPIESYDPNSEKGVLGAETELSPTPNVLYVITTPTPAEKPNKKSYKIAIVGDSFEDTMGESAEFLQKHLKTKYPETDFYIYNYGVGATTVKDGLDNFDKPFKYGTRNYESIIDLKPDIIIIGSYANNPPNPYDRDWQWLNLTQLVQNALKITPNVYMLAEVAPLRAKYGDGPSGVNWEDSYAKIHSGEVVELFENVFGLSKSMNVPLIDAYTPSLKEEGAKEGKPEFISTNDGIHPSYDGHQLIAQKIVEVLKLDK